MPTIRQHSLSASLTLAACALLLASCGQRGPLYLPAPEAAGVPAQAPAAASAPAPQTTQDAATPARKQP
ncbi:LPS translocon maturation chaperone LptM [Comamonas flocculans]|uniref:Lipoprotein n=1 Tax=Comamonas flocculans TaxID=2597701 RepID=A0A5B8RZL7_9BURK|nr:lipoprotein [Comamonas flocculans]QEA13675.1 hypothetical protein FOZ74_11910 [Comamonas flocculans]